MSPRAWAAQRRTALSPSLRAAPRSPTAAFAAGPISPSVRADPARSAAFSLFRVTRSPGTSPPRSSAATAKARSAVPRARVRIEAFMKPPGRRSRMTVDPRPRLRKTDGRARRTRLRAAGEADARVEAVEGVAERGPRGFEAEIVPGDVLRLEATNRLGFVSHLGPPAEHVRRVDHHPHAGPGKRERAAKPG